MKKSWLVLPFAAALWFSPAAQARNVTYHLDIQPVVNALVAEGKIDNSVKFYTEGQIAKERVVQAFREVSSRGRARTGLEDTEIFSAERYTSGSRGKSVEEEDIENCTRAARATLVRFHNAARRHGANAVIGIESYFRRNRKGYSEPGKYECHAGSGSVSVEMQGTVAIVR
ncbi:MAG: hypothetical protein LBG78_03325 [Azoarcus sp.]|nr:hypothetical protein [Azoarcus sp.]